jgi:hypothetical protein
MKKLKLIVPTILTIMVLMLIVPSGGITNGELDGEDHPWVVLLLMETEFGPSYRCSATLLTSTVVLTAGHCTSNFGYIAEEGDYSAMRVFIESDVDDGDNTYPDKGSENSVEAVSWAAHPDYVTAPFWFHDVGVVILEEPGVVLDEYGVLPDVDSLDALKKQRNHEVTFTAVGYGLQQAGPVPSDRDIADRVRMVSYPHLIQINTPGFTGDYSLLLSNNPVTGGTCFGDSGGPNFFGDTNIVAGVTSFGMNGNCAGTGGVFRMDRQNVLDFVSSFFLP